MTDLFSIAGKTALVTGGGRGIGRMIAGGFVDAGARTYISSRNAAVCDAVAAELSEAGECISVPADLSTEAGCRELAAELAGREDKVHILVNNAGNTWGAPLEDFDDAAWDRVLSLNVKGVFHTTKFLLPLLEAAAGQDEPARVINIGSIDGLGIPRLESYAYSTTKAGVHMLTRHLASRLAAEAITVNAIAPGPFDSKMMAFALNDPESRAAIAASVPLGRVGEPDDMAGAVIFLASRAGRYLTGAVIPVDGGIASLRR
jgi:NAD(P)-dependent dehydrogenase (short-subunit alcohol dehydrogenase family)